MVIISKKIYEKLFREVLDIKAERERFNTSTTTLTDPFSFSCFISENPAPSQKQGKLCNILVGKDKLHYSENDNNYSFDGEVEVIFLFEKMIAKTVK